MLMIPDIYFSPLVLAISNDTATAINPGAISLTNDFHGVIPNNWQEECLAIITYTRALNIMRNAPSFLLPERSAVLAFLSGFAQRVTLITHDQWIREMAADQQDSDIDWQTHALNWVTRHFQERFKNFLFIQKII